MRIFRYLMFPFRLLTKSTIIVLLIASISINVASLTFDMVNRFLSTAIEMVAGGASLREKNAQAKANIESELDTQRRDAANVRQDLELEKNRAHLLEDELTEERRSRASLVDNIETEKAKNAELKTKSDTLKTEVDRNELRIADLSEKLTKEKQSLERLERDADALKSQHTKQMREKKTEIKTIKKNASPEIRSPRLAQAQVKRVDELTQRIAGRSATRITRGLGASAGEAVPFIGVAVVVGSLLWDAKDACDTIDEMDEIRTSLSLAATTDTSQKEACSSVMDRFFSQKNDPVQKCLAEFQDQGVLSNDCKTIMTIDWDEESMISNSKPRDQSISWE